MENRNPQFIHKVRTRVAPSPTGDPHVGTAFQALFDYVFAHRYEGKFILRIEDTDQKRYVDESEDVIFEALEWLGLNPDESPKEGGDYGPYRQSERLSLYQKYAKQLIDEDKAYYCFCSAERLQKMREAQQAQKKPPMYDRTCRNLSKEEVSQRLSSGEKAVIRMKIPEHKEIIVPDVLRGQIKFDSDILDDQVILKSDGYPTYHLAVVVDDHLMKITHMKRGEEWLTSAPKHVLLYRYFGWELPVMIHTPTLRNPDRSKLSKRKGNTSLWYYREQGYLKEAILNFLALLVWKHPVENNEVFTKEEMMESFEWEQMNITGPIFDTQKLHWLNGLWIRKKSLEELFLEIKNWATWVSEKGKEKKEDAKEILRWIEKDPDFFQKALALAHERLKIFSELHDLLTFYYNSHLNYDLSDLLQKHSATEITAIILDVKNRLENLTDFTFENWDREIRACADSHGFKHKDLFMSLRSALTAEKATPPLYDLMQVLGKKESFHRLENALNFIRSQNS